MIINPSDLSARDMYKIMSSTVVPRPIAWVSTQSSDGILNAAPFSFFMGITSTPPLFAIAIDSTDDGGKKDTLCNIEELNEFVINVVTEEAAEKMNITAIDFPPELSEFDEAEITPVPSQIVAPPRIKESPVSYECKLVQIIPLGNPVTYLVIGEAVLVHVRDDLVFDGTKIDIGKMRPVGRLVGNDYVYVREEQFFQLIRGKYSK